MYGAKRKAIEFEYYAVNTELGLAMESKKSIKSIFRKLEKKKEILIFFDSQKSNRYII